MENVSLNSSATSSYSTEAVSKRAREQREAFAAQSEETAKENKQKSEIRNAEATAERKARMEKMQSAGSKINVYA